MSYRRLTDEQKNHIAALYKNGLSVLQIEIQTDVSEATVRRILIEKREYKLKAVRPKVTAQDIRAVRERLLEGQGLIEISLQMGVCQKRVRYIAHQYLSDIYTPSRKNKNIRFKAVDVQRILELNRSGWSAINIARNVGIRRMLVVHTLNRNGQTINRQAKRNNPEKMERFKKMLAAGDSRAEISREIGISLDTVYKWIRCIRNNEI